MKESVVPAPWQLQGDGYIFLLKNDKELGRKDAHIPPALLDHYQGGLNVLMYVRYSASSVGPYNELLYIPGLFDFPNGRTDRSITRIYVDSTASLIGGRANWGIPKELADFSLSKDGSELSVSVSVKGEPATSFAMKNFGPSLPVSTRFVPKGLRTLSQLYNDTLYTFALSGKGRMRFASLEPKFTSARLFPDLMERRVLAGVYIEGFEIEFPVAKRLEHKIL